MQDIFEKIKSTVLCDEVMTLEQFRFLKSELNIITQQIQEAGYSLQQKQRKDCPFKIGDKVTIEVKERWGKKVETHTVFIRWINFDTDGYKYAFMKCKKDGTQSLQALRYRGDLQKIELA
jgi:hypothetical protein